MKPSCFVSHASFSSENELKIPEERRLVYHQGVEIWLSIEMEGYVNMEFFAK